MKNIGRNLFFWLIAGTLLFMMLDNYSTARVDEQLTYSEFKQEIQSKKVKSIVYKGDQMTVEGERFNGTKFTTKKPVYVTDNDLDESLRAADVAVEYEALDKPSIWSQLLVGAFPLLLLLGIFFLFMRQMQGGVGGKGGPMTFGRSKAKLLDGGHVKTNFNDVAGCEEAKDDVKELVDFLRDPAKFIKVGGKIPRGILMVGPPGTGKTLLARAVAGEAKVPFFTISGSDFVEMFVGVGASRVRDMFEQAKKHSPCIVFIDEIDAVGRQRGAGLGGGHDEREQTLNQLLVEMDGFETNEGIILIAATNRPDVLDPALLRPGRFDRQVVVPNPDIIGREKILKVHIRKVPISSDVDIRAIARGTPGFSGADLANIVNEAALLAARRGLKLVSNAEFEDSKDKVMMGPERRSMVMTEEERTLTAYHEAGHALVSLNYSSSDPIHKATIIPRGRALGMVMRLPERDQISITREKMFANLAVAMGGRIAEEEVFGYDKVTSGASSDIKQATDLARAMVMQYGMSEKLGFLSYGDNEEEVFLGRSVARTQSMSEETQKQVDSEVKVIVDKSYKDAEKIIKDKRKDLDIIAKGLLDYETLTGDEIINLLKGIDPTREDPSDDDTSGKTLSGSVPKTGGKAQKTEPGLQGT